MNVSVCVFPLYNQSEGWEKQWRGYWWKTTHQSIGSLMEKVSKLPRCRGPWKEDGGHRACHLVV